MHRLLRETFATGSIPVEQQEKLRSLLPEIADHSSERERLAIEAERETTDMKKIEYMADYVGEEFTGVISGVTAFGLFVELDNGVEGLVHVSTMTNDFYEYVEERRNGSSYHRVYVTGLNNAVWPDPPGYRERKEREEKASAKKEKQARAPKHRPRPHRKTEGGTGNSK